MNLRQWITSLLALGMVAMLVACSSSSSKPISVTFSGTPPASMAEGGILSLTAFVANDKAGGGVDWTATCGANPCGSFSSSNTASGTATNFTAPGTIPSSGSVTIMATSVTDSTQSVSATITITGASTLADGTYVFSLAGQDTAAGYLNYVAGAFTVASGTITGGEQDLTDYANKGTLFDAITGGTVTTTADGNLQISLTTGDTSVGVSGVETLNGTMVSGVRALINEFDASATASGELDLQTGATPGQGSYAFFLNGGDCGGCYAGVGGVVTVDGQGSISGTGSVFDLDDCGTISSAETIDPSTVSKADSFGRITVSLDLTTSGVGGIGLVGYVVDGNRIRLVENASDPIDYDGFYGVTGGTAFTQIGAGGFSTASVAGSSFVFATNGQDSNGYLQVAGVVNFNADGKTVTGTLNFNDLTGTGIEAPTAFTGSYGIDPTGRVTLTMMDAGATFGFGAQMYLDGNGHGPLVTMDANAETAGYGFLQTGGGSFTAASFAGNYGFDTTGIDWNSYYEFDTIGPASSDGVAVLTGTFDQNLLFGAQTPAIPLTDGYTADPSGIFTGTLTGLDISFGSQDNFAYYLVDPTKVVAIQTDPNQLTLGYFELQQ